jgi:steroid 5-alpha reductase family enzyme
MPLVAIVVVAATGLVLAFSAVWLWQLRTANAGMIDPVWAASLGAVAVLAGLAGAGAGLNRALVAAGGGAWGARLALHLWRRNYGRPEDARYRQLRDEWGPAAARKLFGFFQLQGVVALLLAVAFFVPAWRPEPVSALNAGGAIAVWLIAVVGEALADRQLARFAADPRHRGQVCREGLWRYSRHPNYFFECVHWLAYTVLSIRLPWGWLTLAPPLLMAWLLMKLSGIPLLEARLVQTRAGYDEYRRTTSALIPWPPRRTPHGRRPGHPTEKEPADEHAPE